MGSKRNMNTRYPGVRNRWRRACTHGDACSFGLTVPCRQRAQSGNLPASDSAAGGRHRRRDSAPCGIRLAVLACHQNRKGGQFLAQTLYDGPCPVVTARAIGIAD